MIVRNIKNRDIFQALLVIAYLCSLNDAYKPKKGEKILLREKRIEFVNKNDSMVLSLRKSDCLSNLGKFSCLSGKCINATQVCDKSPDCEEGSDEFADCEKKCEDNKCEQGCLPLLEPQNSKPYACYCNEGFKLSGDDQTTCPDINECLNYRSCSQLCTNSPGSFSCSCIEGFDLEKDNVSCHHRDANVLLVYAQGSSLRILYPEGKSKPQTIVEDSGLPIAVSFDARNNDIYWSCAMSKQEAIYKYDMDKKKVEKVVDTGLILPEGIAFDWIARNIYFTDSNKSHIGVCTASGKFCSVLIQERMDRPRDIALEPSKGLMFWTDWGYQPSILKAGMDGSTPKAIIMFGLKWPNGIAVDHGGSRIYWVDAGTDLIETARFDGSNREVVITSQQLLHPFSIDVFGDFVYWSDWNSKSLDSVDKRGVRNMYRKITLSYHETISGLAIFDIANQPKNRRNQCFGSGCSHICTLTPYDSYSCKCPIGMLLDSKNQTKCIDDENQPKIVAAYNSTIKTMRLNSIGKDVADEYPMKQRGVHNIGAIVYNPIEDAVIFSCVTAKTIFKFQPSSNTLSVLVSHHISSIKGLDIDLVAGNLYWADNRRGSVEAMSLSTGTRIAIIEENVRPYDLVLAPNIRKLFLVNVDHEGIYLMTMSMNGQTVNHQEPLDSVPTALTFDDGSNQIFWCDAEMDRIEFMKADGFGRTTLKIKTSNPFGLASFKGTIFYTDRHTQQLYSTQLGTSIESAPMYIGYGTDENSHQSYKAMDSYIFGNFHAKLSIQSKDLTSLKKLIDNHECSNSSKSFKDCSHICVLSDFDMDGTCLCPTGMQISSDDKTCTPRVECLYKEFQCEDNTCVSQSYVCDGISDCLDGSDEAQCYIHKPCKVGDFVCKSDNVCQPKEFQCDQIKDCEDGSDEMDCAETICTNDKMFMCNDVCLPISWKCDGKVDCFGGHDEKDCPEPPKVNYDCPDDGFFMCESSCISMACNNNCIPKKYVCDGRRDCKGSEDETGCTALGSPTNISTFGTPRQQSQSSSLRYVAVAFIVILSIGAIAALIYLLILCWRRHHRPGKVVVRPYVQQWVKFVSGRNERELDEMGNNKNIYDDVYNGGNTYSSSPAYEEIDNKVVYTDTLYGEKSSRDSGLTGSERNSFCDEQRYHAAFSAKDTLLDKEFV